MSLRRVRIELRMHKIHLHVQFPCLISFLFKIARQEIQYPSSSKLEQGRAVFTSQLVVNTDIPYDYHSHQTTQRKASIIIYILSQAIGKNTAGICNFEWGHALESPFPCNFTRHFERCPDKQARVEFSVRAEFINQNLRELSPEIDILARRRHMVESKSSRRVRQSPIVEPKIKSRCKSIIKEDLFTSRDSPRSPNDLHKSTYTPITSRVEPTVKRFQEDNRRSQVLKFELLEKEKWIRRLEVESQSYKQESMGLKEEIERYKSKGRPREVSVNRENERLKSRCKSLEETVDELKLFRLMAQKPHVTFKQPCETPAGQQYKIKCKHLQQQVTYYRRSKQTLQQTLKDHLRTYKTQHTQLTDLKQQHSLLQLKLEKKQTLHKEDQRKNRQRINQLERQKYRLILQIEHLKVGGENRGRGKSVSAERNRMREGEGEREKERLGKKNEELKKELRVLTQFRDSYSKEIEGFNLLISNYKVENQHISNQLSFSREECGKLKREIQTSEEEKRRQENARMLQCQQLSQSNTRIYEVEIELKRLEMDHQNIKRELESMKKELESRSAAETHLTITLNEYKSREKEHESRYSRLEHEYNTSRQRHQVVVSSEEMMKVEKEQLLFMSQQIQSEMEDMKTENQERVSRLEGEILRLGSEREQILLKNRKMGEVTELIRYQRDAEMIQSKRLRQELSEEKERENIMRDKLKRYQDLVQEYRDDIFSKEKVEIELRNKVSHLQSDTHLKAQMIENHSNSRVESERRYQLLEKELRELEGELSRREEEIGRVNRVVHSKEMEIRERDTKIHELEMSLVGGNHRFDEIEQSVRITNKEREYERMSIQSIKRVNEDLLRINQELQGKVLRCEEQLMRKEAEINRYYQGEIKLKGEVKMKAKELQEMKRSTLERYGVLRDRILNNNFEEPVVVPSLPSQHEMGELNRTQSKIMESLQQSLLTFTGRIDTLESHNKVYQRDIMDSRSQNKRLGETIKTLKAQIERMREQHQRDQIARTNQLQRLQQLTSAEEGRVTYIQMLNKEIQGLRGELGDGQQQRRGEGYLLEQLNLELKKSQQMLAKAHKDWDERECRLKQLQRQSGQEYSSELRLKEEQIGNLKKRVQSSDNERILQEERSKSMINSLQSNIDTLNSRIKDLQSQSKILSSHNSQEESIIQTLLKQKQDLQTLYHKQKQQNKATQQQNLKQFQTHINNVLDQKDRLYTLLEHTKQAHSTTTQTLQKRCSLLQKQLSEADKELTLLKNLHIPMAQSTTYFMKSINQFQQVNKQFIDKFRDIQKGMELTQSQKIKIINKIREFVLLLLRCKTKNLERGRDIKELQVIIEEYKLLQQKINYLVEYSFTVFEMEVPVQFDSEINSSIEEYMHEIASLKEKRQDIQALNPASKFKRVQRSISLIGDHQ